MPSQRRAVPQPLVASDEAAEPRPSGSDQGNMQIEDTAQEAAGEEAEDEEDAEDTQAMDPAMAKRMEKLKQLRLRMNESAKANRKDLVDEARRSHTTAKESARLERKKAQAEALGEKAEALATGEDLERKRNWEYSIEDNEKWDKKMKRKKARGDFEFTTYDDMSRRKYKKDIDALKPDLASYNRQRAEVEGAEINEASGSSAIASGSSTAITQQRAAENLYRDANSFVYADHKPTEDEIDSVIGKMNQDLAKRTKRSRIRKDEDADVTYINDKNKMFNKKVARFYDKHTKDIRESFERGTAL